MNKILAAPCLVATLLAVTSCSLLSTDPSFEVGDCVTIEKKALGHALKSADCSEARGTFDPNERTYRVDSVIEGTDGSCPELRGFFPVEFVHEPDDVVYCLVQES